MRILSLGEKIKQRRKELDLTLKNLAGDRITAGQISLIESGKSNPSMDLLEYLAGALNVSVEHLMETEETQADKICLYYENIAEVNIYNNNINIANEALKTSYEYIDQYNLELRKATNLYLKAMICEKQKEYDEAQELLLSANNIYIKHNCNDKVIKVFLLLGKITLNLNAYHSAYSYFQQAEKVFQESNVYDELLIGQVYYYISKTLRKLGVEEKSLEYMKLAEEKFNLLKDDIKYGQSFIKMSEKSFEEGRLDDAIEYTERSLQIFEHRNTQYSLTDLFSGMGELFSEFGYVNKSFENLEDAQRYENIVSEEGIINTLIIACNNYIKLKDEKNATVVLQKISGKLQEMTNNDGTLVCKYHVLKYKINLLEKKFDEAERTLLDTLNYTLKMGYKKEAAEIAISLGKFYVEIGREDEAKTYLNEGVKILDEINDITDF